MNFDDVLAHWKV